MEVDKKSVRKKFQRVIKKNGKENTFNIWITLKIYEEGKYSLWIEDNNKDQKKVTKRWIINCRVKLIQDILIQLFNENKSGLLHFSFIFITYHNKKYTY